MHHRLIRSVASHVWSCLRCCCVVFPSNERNDTFRQELIHCLFFSRAEEQRRLSAVRSRESEIGSENQYP